MDMQRDVVDNRRAERRSKENKLSSEVFEGQMENILPGVWLELAKIKIKQHHTVIQK